MVVHSDVCQMNCNNLDGQRGRVGQNDVICLDACLRQISMSILYHNAKLQLT